MRHGVLAGGALRAARAGLAVGAEDAIEGGQRGDAPPGVELTGVDDGQPRIAVGLTVRQIADLLALRLAERTWLQRRHAGLAAALMRAWVGGAARAAKRRKGAAARHLRRALGQRAHSAGALRACSSESFFGAPPSRRPPVRAAPGGRSRDAGARSPDHAGRPACVPRTWAPGPARPALQALCAPRRAAMDRPAGISSRPRKTVAGFVAPASARSGLRWTRSRSLSPRLALGFFIQESRRRVSAVRLTRRATADISPR